MREYQINYDAGSARAVPDSSLDALVRLREGDAALVYLYLIRNGGKMEPEQAEIDLGMDSDRLERAVASLQRLRVLRGATEEVTQIVAPIRQSIQPMEYTRQDVEKAENEDMQYRWLNTQAEKHLGHFPTYPERQRLLYIRQQIQLPFEVTALLMTHLAEEAQKRGKALSITTLQHKAAEWAGLGLDSTEKAEAQIERESAFWTLWRGLGMGDRAPVKQEEEKLRGWLNQGFDPELIRRACEETIYNTGKLKWAYAGKILERWQTRGYRTPEDVDRGEAAAGSPGAVGGVQDAPVQSGFASAEAEAAYRERMRRLYEESRRENADGE